MRKTWTTLVVLGILLCMFVSIGANAQAAEDALTILAVDGDVLTDEQITALKNEYSNGYILDVSGEAPIVTWISSSPSLTPWKWAPFSPSPASMRRRACIWATP